MTATSSMSACVPLEPLLWWGAFIIRACNAGAVGGLSQLSRPDFPPPAERDPERHRDQVEVEAESGVSHVDGVEEELPRPQGIARRVDLRESRQDRPHRMASRVSRNALETH